jgi:hypothetical protein
MSPEMHKEHAWVIIQHVVVQSGYIDVMAAQRALSPMGLNATREPSAKMGLSSMPPN